MLKEASDAAATTLEQIKSMKAGDLRFSNTVRAWCVSVK